MAQHEIKIDDSVPGDVDWARPETPSQEEFLRRWRQARENQPNPIEQVEKMRRKLPVGFGGNILLDNETA